MTRIRLTAGALGLGLGLVLVAPATPAATGTFTLKLSYSDTSDGTNKGKNDVVGVTGRGTLTLALKSARSPVLAALAKGVPFVVRYDQHFGQPERWRGFITAKSPAIGSVCAGIVVNFGKYDPNAGTGFAPASGTFTTVGGKGAGAMLKLAGTYKVTDVTGSSTVTITATGSATAATAPGRAPAAGCPR